MKTPREILLANHRAAEPALDTVRAQAVAAIAVPEKPDPRFPGNFVEFLISLRWHAASMSALWLVVALLGGEHSQTSPGAIASDPASSPPLAYIIALREYSEALDEANGPPARQQPPPIPHACADPRRTWECNEFA
jgi:hypothetical protein